MFLNFVKIFYGFIIMKKILFFISLLLMHHYTKPSSVIVDNTRGAIIFGLVAFTAPSITREVKTQVFQKLNIATNNPTIIDSCFENLISIGAVSTVGSLSIKNNTETMRIATITSGLILAHLGYRFIDKKLNEN